MERYMEENLDAPLKEVLSIMQDRIMNQTSYFGIKTWKSPIDAWVYQEIIYQNKPDVIIEIGNFSGGSTLFLAHLLDLMGMDNSQVIGIDISHKNVPDIVKQHSKIKLFEGDACLLFDTIKGEFSQDSKVLVIEDSSHTYDNTLKVLRTYSSLIQSGGYFIVEDGICHHGLDLGPKPGPYEAVEAFIMENKEFEVDRTKESFGITWNPMGYLRKK